MELKKKMLQLAVISILYLTVVYSQISEADWVRFKTQYQKIYSSPEEEAIRRHAWETNMRKIQAHNRLYAKGKVSYFLGENKYADLTFEQLTSKMLGPVSSAERQKRDISKSSSETVTHNLGKEKIREDRGIKRDNVSHEHTSTPGDIHLQNKKKTDESTENLEKFSVDCEKFFREADKMMEKLYFKGPITLKSMKHVRKEVSKFSKKIRKFSKKARPFSNDLSKKAEKLSKIAWKVSNVAAKFSKSNTKIFGEKIEKLKAYKQIVSGLTSAFVKFAKEVRKMMLKCPKCKSTFSYKTEKFFKKLHKTLKVSAKVETTIKDNSKTLQSKTDLKINASKKDIKMKKHLKDLISNTTVLKRTSHDSAQTSKKVSTKKRDFSKKSSRFPRKASGPEMIVNSRTDLWDDGLPGRVLPDYVDWRTKGCVAEVKDQGECNAGWAFSATGAVESLQAKTTGQLVSLSESNLLDCSQAYGTQGCQGGSPIQAFLYISNNIGIDTESSYPYVPKQRTCSFDRANIGAVITYALNIPEGQEGILQWAVVQQPISVSINANSNFHLYKGGIFEDPTCESSLLPHMTHGVLLVGYDNRNTSSLWLVKNSWGRSWGEGGYIRMSKNKNNQCGIASKATFPIP